MPAKNTPDARGRILKAAVKLFAEKSFEGSRIEEIAKEAGVPKSLIYYHFKSKHEILEVLTRNFISEYLYIIEGSLDDTHESKARELPDRMKKVYREFGEKNSDLIRVMLIDSLKKTKEKPVLFEVVEAMIQKERKAANGEALKSYDVQERLVVEFFTSFIPNYAYICFAESFAKYFGINREVFDRLYLKAYEETHGAYHKNHK